jgi:exo-beta-1,3-glucanase (GH17 family)
MKVSGMCFSIGRDVEPEFASRALQRIAEDTHAIRTYSVEPYHSEALRLGLKVVPGCWIGGEADVNLDCMHHLIDGCDRFKPELAIVGHEVLLRGDLKAHELVDCIKYVRERVAPHTEITTGEEANQLLRYPSVMRACDVIGMQYYPFQYGVHIDRAVQDFIRTYYDVVYRSMGKRVVVLETGWPSDEGSIGDAVASLENARQYFRDLTTWSRRENVEIHWFEAYNETFKRTLEGPWGAHWGLRHHEHHERKYWHS